MIERSEPTPSRAAVLTPAGRGAVAVVAVEGPAAIAALQEAYRPGDGRTFADHSVGRVALGRFLQEDVIVCKLSASSAEVHCHGGRAAARRIVDVFASAGCDIATWDDWTPSYDVSSGVGPSVAGEARRALAQAATLQTAAILLDQLEGAADRAVDDFAALVKAGEHVAARQKLEALRGRTTWGSRLIDPPRIVLSGWPNVGKSSLINALLGYQRAIVYDQPGTTRDVLSAPAALNGWPVLLVDVAGLRAGAEAIEAAGVALARRQLEAADLVIWVLDAAEIHDCSADGIRAMTEQQTAPWKVNFRRPPAIVVNKIDLAANLDHELHDQIILASALTGEGVKALADSVARQLFPDAPLAGQAVPFTPRQTAAIDAAQSAMDSGELEEAVARMREYAGGA